jgi:hypothetical protein
VDAVGSPRRATAILGTTRPEERAWSWSHGGPRADGVDEMITVMITGVSPRTEASLDEISYVVTEPAPDATVRASALEMDLWPWRRKPMDSVEFDRDTALPSQLRETSAILCRLRATRLDTRRQVDQRERSERF